MSEAYESNSIAKVSGYIAKEAIRGLANNSTLLAKADRQYSDEFGQKVGGAKVGNTIYARKPAIFVPTSSKALDMQGFTETKIPLVLNTLTGVHFDFDTTQLTLDMDSDGKDYTERTIVPAGAAIGSEIERLGFKKVAEKASNALVLEKAADEATFKRNILNMNALLSLNLAPNENRTAMVTPDFEAAFVDKGITLFHNQKELDLGYLDGKATRFGNFDMAASSLIYTRTNGAGGSTGVTVSAYTEGATTMRLVHATAIPSVAVGDKIQITGCSLVNPQAKSVIYKAHAVTRSVQAVTAVDSTHVDITIEPIYWTSAGTKNVDVTPVGKAIVFLGTAGKSYACMPFFQKYGLTFGNADLYLPNNVEMGAREKAFDVSLRFIRDYRVGTDDLPTRIEVLHFWELLRPEWCGVIEVGLD